MGFMSHVSATVEHGKYDALTESEIARMAEMLIDEFRGEADIVAARRADHLFRAGDTSQATQWLNVFRRLAVSGLTD